MSKFPELLSQWKTPWDVTADGIKDANGCWVMDGASARLSLQIVALANFAGEAAAAAQSMADNYQTSENHHPGWVLVPASAFDALRASIAKA